MALNTMIGEAFTGEGNEVAHVCLAIGRKGTPFEASFITALAQPSEGHPASLALLEPNLPCKPFTVVTSELTLKSPEQTALLLGPAHAAASLAVADSVAEGTVPQDQADELLIIASVFIHWNARDKRKVYDHNYEAIRLAIKRAFAGEPRVDEVLARRKTAKHFFYDRTLDAE